MPRRAVQGPILAHEACSPLCGCSLIRARIKLVLTKRKKAWLFIVEPTKLRKNLKGLYYGDEAQKYISEERERLFSIAHEDMRIAADGGVSVEDIFEELESESWADFVKKFLKT